MNKMSLAEELKWRGQIKDRTFSSLEWINKPRVFYLGTDCSSDSLTVGNLAVYMLARRLRKHGWKTVLLVGGATSLIGDPGGKDEERELLSREQVKANVAGIERQVKRLFTGMDFTLVDNYDWFKDIGYLDFLREVGKHYSMTELLQRDFIRSRIGESGGGISYAEFSYSLIQGYDYWHLYKKYNVELQIGGSDQWGNMLSGVPLVRKKENAEVHALSMPLVINKTTGKKFGKSEAGAVWLDPTKTSPNDFYQFWVNVGDDHVGGYLKIFTELGKEDIAEVMKEFEANRAGRHAQHTLAYEVTKLVHGIETAKQAKDHAASLKTTSVTDLAKVTQGEAATGENIIDVLVRTNLASSKTEARQLLAAGGIYINDQPTAKTHLSHDDFKNNLLALRRGKALKNTVVLKLHQSK